MQQLREVIKSANANTADAIAIVDEGVDEASTEGVDEAFSLRVRMPLLQVLLQHLHVGTALQVPQSWFQLMTTHPWHLSRLLICSLWNR